MKDCFIRIPEQHKSKNWNRYAYCEKLSKLDNLHCLETEISEEVLNHFRSARNIQFESEKKKEKRIIDFISSIKFEYNDRTYKFPYLWSNSKLIIRQANFYDVDGILDILHQANVEAPGGFSKPYIKKITLNGLTIVLTDLENTVRGFKTLPTSRNKIGGNELLYIEKNCRKQGAFRIICELTFDAAKYADYEAVLTQCIQENPVAEMYEHIGFRRKKETKQVKYKYKGEFHEYTVVMFEYPIINSNQQTFF